MRPQLTDEYLADPYPCKIRIISNGGVRIISLPPAEEITEDEKTIIQNQFIAAKMQCFKEIMLPYKIMKFKWLPDPPPIKYLAQIWQIVVSEMAGNEVVEILDAKESVLASAIANNRKVAQLSTFFEGEAVINDLAVKIGMKTVKSAMSSPKRKQKRVKRHVSIKQIQLALKSSISPTGSFEGLAVIREGRQTLLKYNTNIGEFIWDISVPEFPSLLGTIAYEKKEKTIYVRQDKKLVLSGTDLKVINNREKVITTLTKSGIKKAAVQKNRLYSMSSQEIRIFNLDNPDSPKSLQLSKGTLKSIVRIELAKLAGVKESLCLIDNKGTIRIIDVSDRKIPKELGRYFQTPWFLDGQKFGKLFVRFYRETGKIMIYSIEQVVEN